MREVLVIGNSHVAALKLGWDMMNPSPAGVSVRFFSAPGQGFSQLRLRGGSRFGAFKGPATPADLVDKLRRINGNSHVDLESFDDILIVGGVFRPNAVLSILRDFDVDEAFDMGSSRRLSAAAFCAILHDIAEAGSPWAFWSKLLRPRVTVLPKPRPSETVRTGNIPQDDAVLQFLFGTTASVSVPLDWHDDACAAALDRRGIGFLRQPKDTVAESGLTFASYSRGSLRLNGAEQPANDARHMNPDYGRRCLQDYLDHLPQLAA
ncbi:MAG: hypothetical protein WBB85_04330 [Albidovulum sp.]|uniref:hypothetical protein n=1 Tax=Albidovulum sp. TaxID=1872424 RepID=UPI003CB115E1